MGIYVIIAILSLVKVADRPVQSIPLSPQQKEEIRQWEKSSIVEQAMDMTCRMLTFSEKNDIARGKANCVGYAQLYCTICNYAFQIHHVDGKAKPAVGYIKVGGLNLCSIASQIAPGRKWKNFTKDHDFVEIINGNDTTYIDPSVRDVLGI